MKDKTRRRIKLTPKQKEARGFVDKWVYDNGFPPTYREVAIMLSVKSSNTAYTRLRGYRHKMVKN